MRNEAQRNPFDEKQLRYVHMFTLVKLVSAGTH